MLRRLYCASWHGDRAIRDQNRGVYLALAEIYDDGSRSDAARIGGVGLQIVRDWVLWFMTPRVANGLVNGKAPGAPSLLNGPFSAKRCGRSSRTVRDASISMVVVRWRLIDLAHWLCRRVPDLYFNSRRSAANCANMGFRKLSARPRHHAQDEASGLTVLNMESLPQP